jgi:hypothetical protein
MQRVRDDFAAAVAAFRLDELELETDEDTARELEESLARTNLLLLGETHGATETPAALYALARRFGLRGLALEWDEALRPLLDRYLRAGELDLERPPPELLGGDGRITAGHFALLRRLAAEGRLDSLVLFNADGATFDERDSAMAASLLAGRSPETPTLAVAGKAHTSLRRHEWGLPLGAHVAAAVPGVASVELRFLNGACFNLAVKPLPDRPATRPGAAAALVRAHDGAIVLELPRASPAAVPRAS